GLPGGHSLRRPRRAGAFQLAALWAGLSRIQTATSKGNLRAGECPRRRRFPWSPGLETASAEMHLTRPAFLPPSLRSPDALHRRDQPDPADSLRLPDRPVRLDG